MFCDLALYFLFLSFFLFLISSENVNTNTNQDLEDHLLRCTAILVGKDATHDGSVFNAYTSDARNSDFRIGKVHGRTFEKSDDRGNSKVRNIIWDRLTYPRYIGYERGELYQPEFVEKNFFKWNLSTPVGSIPQTTEKTYGYIDASYGVMNERQVAIGESTCGAKFSARPLFEGGSALFCINELSRIALERTESAKDAIKLMGSLAEEYGFYGSGYEEEVPEATAGETLTVSDPNEGWVFHILPDDTGKSAIWAAQRVPDDHTAVIGNQFTIQTLNLSDADNFLASKNIYDVALKKKLWIQAQEGKFDDFNFAATYARFPVPLVEVTDLRIRWGARRPWRLMTLLAPSSNLKPDDLLANYPFSVKVENKLHLRDIFDTLRDHYEGTKYDLTKGFGAGPFGDPNRFTGVPEGVASNLTRRGNFERPISVTSVAYCYVAQSRAWLPHVLGGRVFFSPHSPHSGTPSILYPISSEMPASLSTGSLYRFSFDSSWWIFCLVTNYVQKAWVHLYPEVHRVRSELENYLYVTADEVETGLMREFPNIDNSADTSSDIEKVRAELTTWQQTYAKKVLTTWKNLFEELVTKFHDGGMVNNLFAQDISYTAKPWPLWWLEQAGFFRVAAHDTEPLIIPPHTDNPPSSLCSIYPGSLSSTVTSSNSESNNNLENPVSLLAVTTTITATPVLKLEVDIFSVVAFAFLFILLGIYLGDAYQRKKGKWHDYQDLE